MCKREKKRGRERERERGERERDRAKERGRKIETAWKGSNPEKEKVAKERKIKE